MNELIRKSLLERRHNLSENFQKTASNAIAEKLLQQNIFQNAESVGLYISVRGEVATGDILKKLFSFNKKIYLPTLQKNARKLGFYRYEVEDVLVENNWGIPEPKKIEKNKIAPQDLDIVLVPMVGFTERGDRLGSGFGYYDQTFSFVKGGVKPRPKLIGLAYAFQQANTIEIHGWDVAVDMVITEQDIFVSHKA